jgi:hypothetical protein
MNIRRTRPSRLSNLILVELDDGFYYDNARHGFESSISAMLAANERRFSPITVNGKPFTVDAD